MTATSTHDTKRSEDVRARISALSGIAEAWTAQVDTWHERNLVHRSPSGVPSPSEELFVYQTLVGAWPLERDEEFGRRIADHLVKALREAKVHTAWLQPDEQHESEVTAFAAALLDDPDFVADLERFAGPVWRAGALDSLAQVALRLLAPGVPDIYQGSELWDLSLTDPDNRRPVDWDRRIAALAELAARAEEGPALVADLADRWTDGVIKLHVTRTGLELRRRDPELYAAGAYLPLAVAGPRAAHVVAFGRVRQGRWAIAVAPRLTSQFAGRRLWAQEGWDGTVVELPEGAPRRWLEALTGVEVEGSGRIEVPAVFGLAPVGLLRSVGDPHPPPDRADDGDDARRPKG